MHFTHKTLALLLIAVISFGSAPLTSYGQKDDADKDSQKAQAAPDKDKDKDKDKTAPVVSGITVTSVSHDTVLVSWTTDEPASSDIDYGIPPGLNQHGPASAALVTSHTITLTGLTHSTTYEFCVLSADADNNRTRDCGHTFTTDTYVPPDAQAPVISNIQVVATMNTIRVIWATDEIATSQISYGTTELYGLETPLDPTLDVQHVMEVSGLTASTTYHLRIRAADNSGNISYSNDLLATTIGTGGVEPELPPIPTPKPSSGGPVALAPNISQILVESASATTTSITWHTDLPSRTYIEYGLTSSYGHSSEREKAPTAPHHRQFLRNLLPNATYHFRIVAETATGAVTYSLDQTFTTPTVLSDAVAPAPVRDLRAADIGVSSFTLNWTAPYDVSGIVTYDINRSNTPLTDANFAEGEVVHETDISADDVERMGAQRSYKVVGLTPGSLVYVALKSVDPYGNVSPISNVVAVRLKTGEDDDRTAPGKVTQLRARSLDQVVLLTWANPADTDFTRTRIVRSTNGYPMNSEDGTVVYDGNGKIYTDLRLTNGQTYYYSLFAYDQVPNYSEPVQLSIAPIAGRTQYDTVVGGVGDIVAVSSGTYGLGHKGPEVEYIQKLLATNPVLYPEGLVTGYFGPLTEAALKRFQEKYGLPQTGKVDPATRAKALTLTVPVQIQPQPISNLDLSYGMQGAPVTTVQMALVKLGYLTEDSVTGYFGTKTRAAVMQFQKDNGITPANGMVGPKTRAAAFVKLAAPR